MCGRPGRYEGYIRQRVSLDEETGLESGMGVKGKAGTDLVDVRHLEIPLVHAVEDEPKRLDDVLVHQVAEPCELRGRERLVV